MTQASRASYWMDGQRVEREAFYAVACDPQRSVVVEACAGAGKTWMLVSRILRALLDGCEPHEILAITFTKKAAAEMRERLFDWLRDFASAASDDDRARELVMRGVPPDQARVQAAVLLGLYRRVLDSGRAIEIHTFHRWFSRLLRAAPMDMLAEIGLPAEPALLESNEELRPEVWQRFLQAVTRDATLTDDFSSLVGELGRHSTQAWLDAALDNRSVFEMADAAGVVDACVPSAAQWQAQWAGLADPAQAVLGGDVNAQLWRLARLWGQLTDKSKALKAAAELEVGLGLSDAEEAFQMIWRALFTAEAKSKPRVLPANAEWPAAAEAVQAIKAARDQQQAHELHARMARLTRVLLQAYADIKRERGVADMDDLERCALHLLRDAHLSGWVQERLDARVRQVLIDEFQDTSPLQWQALHAWLAGYAGAGGGGSGRSPPGVFIVGDPKQSIYRFRRAEPRVFEAAQAFVRHGLGGHVLACDHTRRNAPAVLQLLNRVFDQAQADGSFVGFRSHTTEHAQGGVAGCVQALPPIARQKNRTATPGSEDPLEAATAYWRDSLTTPRFEAEEALRMLEGRQVADAIAALLGQGLQPQDIYVLSRRREALRWVAQALRERHIAHVTTEDLRLIDTPEVRDVVALLDALISPQHDLSLAHLLRSPLFGASDDELLALGARASRGMWWPTLLQGDGCDGWSNHPALQRARKLLPQWQRAAHDVPPHDWLDRIVAQGQWRERLAAAVPAARRPLALSALDAVLAQALELDGGRYLTPYGFVRALKRRPLGLGVPQHSHAVQLLTVHGAKGLEARAVFIVDADAPPARTSSHTLLIDWPAHAAHPTCCAFVRSEGSPPPSLDEAMQHERQMRRREELNALYVAITRAREHIIFSRIEPHQRGDAPSWWQRVSAVPACADETTPAAPAIELWHPPVSVSVAGPEALAGASATGEPPLASGHAFIDLPAVPQASGWGSGRAAPTAAPPAEDAAGGDAYQAHQAQLGRAVHRVLEWLTARPVAQRNDVALGQAARAAAGALGLSAEDASTVSTLAARVLHSAAVADWLDPERLVWAGNEIELVDPHDRSVLRLDRLVARRSEALPAGTLEWWVLDYKLQHHPQTLPAYREQLARYRRAVQALQPADRVRAAFITGVGELVEMPPEDQ